LVSQDNLKTTRKDQKSKTVHHSPREILKNAIESMSGFLTAMNELIINNKSVLPGHPIH
jgi:hypothetical protein